jgi:hypothetical protein
MLSGLIHTILGPLVNNRVFPNTFPQTDTGQLNVKWPAIRYQFVSDGVTPDLCGTPNDELDDARVQLDIVAAGYGTMKELKRNVIAAMAGLSPPALRQSGGFETFDEETKTHRAVMDYVVYPSSSFTGSP